MCILKWAGLWTLSRMRLTVTYIQCLNSAVPHHISSQPGCSTADDNVIVDRHSFGPQHPALLGAFSGVVLERNGSRTTIICGVRAQSADITLVPFPVGRYYAIALWTSSGGVCPINIWRWRAIVDSFKTRRLHPSTVACWAGGAQRIRQETRRGRTRAGW